MAQTYCTELAPTQENPPQRVHAAAGQGARKRTYRSTVTLAAQASGDTIVLANIPAGYTFAGGKLVTDTSLGSATLAIGTAASAAYFKAAGTQTGTDAPASFGKAAAFAEVSPDARQVIATVGAAALPASGTLVIDMDFIAP